jgi:general secretion pathway protein J
VRRAGARRVRGFTLVEIMVATAILAMIGTIIYGAMTASVRGRQTAYRLQERYQTARIAMTKMLRDLESAYISKHRNIDKYPKTLFLGRSDRIDFTYLGHQRVAEGVPESDEGAVSYYLESDPDSPRGQKALFRREKVPIDDRPEKGGVVQKLAENVKEIEFDYWDPKDQDWKKDWKAELSDLEPVEVSADAAGAVGGAAARLAVGVADKLGEAADALTEEENEFILPSRVRIRLVLVDETGKEYTFESQARIYLREPLKW